MLFLLFFSVFHLFVAHVFTLALLFLAWLLLPVVVSYIMYNVYKIYICIIIPRTAVYFPWMTFDFILEKVGSQNWLGLDGESTFKLVYYYYIYLSACCLHVLTSIGNMLVITEKMLYIFSINLRNKPININYPRMLFILLSSFFAFIISYCDYIHSFVYTRIQFSQ